MDFDQLIRQRKSIRKFENKPIPDHIIEKIIQSVPLAPSWANKQGPRYVVVQNSDQVKAVAEGTGQGWTKQAPMFIVVCINPANSGTNTNGLDNFPVDAAIGLYHIILQATNEGLGTCWIGYFNEDKIKLALNIPENLRIIGLTPLGYPKTDPGRRERKPVSHYVSQDTFGHSWENSQ